MTASTSTSPQTSTSTSTCAVPLHFLCPLTEQLMVNPMMTRSGLNFERSAILEHLDSGNDDCPLTGSPLSPAHILPNRRLQAQIQAWRHANGRSAAAAVPAPAATTALSLSGIVTVSSAQKEQVLARRTRPCLAC